MPLFHPVKMEHSGPRHVTVKTGFRRNPVKKVMADVQTNAQLIVNDNIFNEFIRIIQRLHAQVFRRNGLNQPLNGKAVSFRPAHQVRRGAFSPMISVKMNDIGKGVQQRCELDDAKALVQRPPSDSLLRVAQPGIQRQMHRVGQVMPVRRLLERPQRVSVRQIADFMRFKQHQLNIIHLVRQKGDIGLQVRGNDVRRRSQAERKLVL